MRNFFRTTGGKTLAFILCILSVLIFISSVFGAYLMTEVSGFDFYFHSEESLKERVLSDYIEDRASSTLWSVLSSESNKENEDFLAYEVKDSEGVNIYRNESFISPDFEFDFLVSEIGNRYHIYRGNIQDTFGEDGDGKVYTVAIDIIDGAGSPFNMLEKLFHIAYSLRYYVYVIGALSFILAIAFFVCLIGSAGRRPKSDELYPGPLNIIPTDVLLCICAASVGILVALVDEFYGSSFFTLFAIAMLFILIPSIVLAMLMSIAIRVKGHTLISNSVCAWVVKLCIAALKWIGKGIFALWNGLAELLKSIPIFWKGILAMTVLFAIELFAVLIWGRSSLFILFFEKLVLFFFGIQLMVSLKKLKDGGKALADGNLSFVTDTKGMLFDFKDHGENLNSIAAGMSKAVDERLKSERMKTELITNVSHDIKTPLTSIINYANLIGNEPCENEKINEYKEVLIRQSERLKRLIEDLVEASKASTGNLEVSLAPCDAGVFLTQASGEYEEKLKSAELALVVKQPEKELMILADGRRMQRVFDNLMNNICKYAQSGTRVYLSLEEKDGFAVISFKNTSRDPLDMTEDELLERFTRGDSSRNTEGNGLGLSIAKSLAELQNGKLNLSVDGDLFKAVLSFPLI